jgi:hypothetical protein
MLGCGPRREVNELIGMLFPFLHRERAAGKGTEVLRSLGTRGAGLPPMTLAPPPMTRLSAIRLGALEHELTTILSKTTPPTD